MPYFAHSAPAKVDWEPLSVHLREVARRAEGFAAPFGAGEEARLAGLLHDLGKYSDRFTARLEGRARGLDHWSIGAVAAGCVARRAGMAAALAIAGHHVGLASLDLLTTFGRSETPKENWTETDPRSALARLAADGIEPPVPAGSLFDLAGPRAGGMVDVRMLFSALVDADFLATEEHFRRFDPPPFPRPEGLALEPGRALAALTATVERLAAGSVAAPGVRALRDDLLHACLAAAEGEPGLFTLTAPTGSGKTLAMLAFALRHAERHGLRRIVLAVPYLAILEQTAGIYRDLLDPVFGEGYVLEHHSLAGLRPELLQDDAEDEPERRRRLLAENWDAPLVLTTNVQLLESLFANRPAACRKLHRLARSVLLFDEAQTLPPELAVPTLAALSRLAERYGSTVVFATATQPAFDHLDGKVRPLAASGWHPCEITPEELRLFDRARRTRIAWRLDAPASFVEIAAEIAALPQALAIVNLKEHARVLAGEVAARDTAGLFHLSTNLCPAHREVVLAEVRRRLERGEPCRLVATQCVEAGVDLDFPHVLRAFGPLESIAQAAGRCNRNGRRPEPGEVRVFRPEDERYPPGGYAQAARATHTLVRDLGTAALDLDDPELFRRYYREFFDASRIVEANPELARAIAALDFAEVARLYRLIEKDAIEVLVPYDPEAFAALTAELKAARHLTTRWVRRARRFAVSLYRPQPKESLWAYLLPATPATGRDDERARDDWFVLADPDLYDRQLLGLTGAPNLWIA